MAFSLHFADVDDSSWLKNNEERIASAHVDFIDAIKAADFDINRAPCVIHAAALASNIRPDILANINYSLYTFGDCHLCEIDIEMQVRPPPYDGPPEEHGASLIWRSYACHLKKTDRPIFNTAMLTAGVPQYTDMYVIQGGQQYILSKDQHFVLAELCRRTTG
jgi:hypothetical protein